MNPEDVWKNRAERLWQIIDDIDTVSDEAKGNDAYYRKRVESLQARRHNIAESLDGYTLTWKEVQ